MTADVDGMLPLHCAVTDWVQVVRSADAEIVQLLLAAAPGADMIADEDGCLPLHAAAFHSTAAGAVGQLLGVAPQTAMTAGNRGWVPLHYAAVGDCEAIV